MEVAAPVDDIDEAVGQPPMVSRPVEKWARIAGRNVGHPLSGAPGEI